jgi:hypothetical protein
MECVVVTVPSGTLPTIGFQGLKLKTFNTCYFLLTLSDPVSHLVRHDFPVPDAGEYARGRKIGLERVKTLSL